MTTRPLTSSPETGALPAALIFRPRHFAGLLLDPGLPVLLFSLVVVSKTAVVLPELAALLTSPSLLLAAEVAHAGFTIGFLALVIGMYLLRPAPLGRRARPWQHAVALSGAFVMTLVVFLPPAAGLGATDMILATSAMAIGQAIALGGLLWLRRCFSIAPEARGLVTTGPYRWVRHPLYLGEFIMAAGLIVPVISIPAILIFGAFCLLQLGRVREEERALTAAFPEEYPAYAGRTARFIPGLI